MHTFHTTAKARPHVYAHTFTCAHARRPPHLPVYTPARAHMQANSCARMNGRTRAHAHAPVLARTPTRNCTRTSSAHAHACPCSPTHAQANARTCLSLPFKHLNTTSSRCAPSSQYSRPLSPHPCAAPLAFLTLPIGYFACIETYHNFANATS
eukprot:3476121-Pleurochrysis_carterae.AAC.1